MTLPLVSLSVQRWSCNPGRGLRVIEMVHDFHNQDRDEEREDEDDEKREHGRTLHYTPTCGGGPTSVPPDS